jgi:AraC family transcriptional regulator of adaptative response / DNA-3-methyladenine glycosylase II
VHFARKLIDETDLPMSEIAFSAGFKSIRRFNDLIKKTYGRAPGKLRNDRDGTADRLKEGIHELHLPYRPPYDWDALVGYLRNRATPGIEIVDEGSYRRSIEIDGTPGIIEVSRAPRMDCLLLKISDSHSGQLLMAVERVRRMFDLAADPMEITSQLARDPRLARIIPEHPGLRVPGAWDGFELSVRAILGQQISVKAATTIAGRLVRRYGKKIDHPRAGGMNRLYPTPDSLAEADMTGLGLPNGRTRAIRELARAVVRGWIRFDLSIDRDEILKRLTKLPGIGDWTGQYILMRALREPDAFPDTDIGLLRTASGAGIAASSAALLGEAEAWRPWRAYAAMHLWMS